MSDAAHIDAGAIKAALLKHPAIFCVGDMSQVGDTVVTSGFEALDRALGGGWPLARITEVLCDHVGIGELSLLLSVLPKRATTELVEQSSGNAPAKSSPRPDDSSTKINTRRALLILPVALRAGLSCVAYAPALERAGVDLNALAFVSTSSAQQTLWATEQALLSGATRAVFAWIREHPHDFALRRIAQAARKSNSLCFLMRSMSAAKRASPAELRIAVVPMLSASQVESRGAIEVRLLKRRGLLREMSLQLDPRTLPCLATNRTPIVLPTKLTTPQSHSPLVQATLRTALQTSFATTPKVRERSVSRER